jgi:hypothetical protein
MDILEQLLRMLKLRQSHLGSSTQGLTYTDTPSSPENMYYRRANDPATGHYARNDQDILRFLIGDRYSVPHGPMGKSWPPSYPYDLEGPDGPMGTMEQDSSRDVNRITNQLPKPVLQQMLTNDLDTSLNQNLFGNALRRKNIEM